MSFTLMCRPLRVCYNPKVFRDEMEKFRMLRLGLSGTLALALMAVVASAQDVDCATKYKNFMEKMTREQQRKMSGEQLAALNRRAQRIYDACQTGHLADPRALFEGLDRLRN